MASNPSSPPTAAQLKEDGDKLFRKKDYAAAYRKYAEAIGLDDKNAVLYANRGACSFAMGKFMDAAKDSLDATELDPKYTKAWVRAGLSYKRAAQHRGSVTAFRKALESLPVSGLTDAQQSLKQQCEDELRELKTTLSKPPEIRKLDRSKLSEMPWNRALRMRAELQAAGPKKGNCSAWIILKAYQEFKDGMNHMSKVKRIQTPEGPAIEGMCGALTLITNGIMRDPRVFHVDDPKFWDHYNMQVKMEIQKNDAEAFTMGGAQTVIDEATKMLEKKGWTAVRHALSITIRCWILRGHIENGVAVNYQAAVEFFTRAIDVLEWGREAWRDVPPDQRGAIFGDTFVRGVKCLQLDSYINAYMRDKASFPLESLHNYAQDIIQELDAIIRPPTVSDPGFFMSFYAYPRGQALATLGLYYKQLALAQQNDPAAAESYYRRAVESYKTTGDVYPDDEEYHVYYLNCAVELMFFAHCTIRDVLEVMDRIRARLPRVEEIWEFSSRAENLGEAVKRTLEIAEQLQSGVAAGTLKMDSLVSTDML